MDVWYAVKWKVNGKYFVLTRKSVCKIRKTVYEKIFRKPFSKITRASPRVLDHFHSSHSQSLLSFSQLSALFLTVSSHPQPRQRSTTIEASEELRDAARCGEARRTSTIARAGSFGFFFFFFLRYTRFAAIGFDYRRFWVMVFPVMGFGVVGGLKLMGFG